jgi:hypothetical protein
MIGIVWVLTALSILFAPLAIALWRHGPPLEEALDRFIFELSLAQWFALRLTTLFGLAMLVWSWISLFRLGRWI